MVNIICSIFALIIIFACFIVYFYYENKRLNVIKKFCEDQIQNEKNKNKVGVFDEKN